MNKYCECIDWCRTEVNIDQITNHHPNCDHYNDSLIKVYKISYDGAYYFDKYLPDLEDLEIGTIISIEEMHKECYEQLPEFQGF